MKNKNGVVLSGSPGGSDSEISPEPITIAKVEEFLKRDLGSCLHMLDSIYRDQDILKLLAQVMHGKYMNALHKAELSETDKQHVGADVD